MQSESDEGSERPSPESKPGPVVVTDEQIQEQRLSTPTREGEQPGGGHSSSSRGVGATSLQKYLVSVGETLTPDDDDAMSESDEQQKAQCIERLGMSGKRRAEERSDLAELKSARDVLAMVLDDVQSRNRRGAARQADISRMATSILASVRELGQNRDPPLEYQDAGTQTDSCEGLAPLSELRIEDEVDMVQMMLLTNRVATLAAQDAGIASPATANAESACPMHAGH